MTDCIKHKERTTLAVARFVGHEKEVMAATITPDGKRVVSVSADETLRIWDLDPGKEVATLLGGHEDWVIAAVAITPDGRYALSGSRKDVIWWDLATESKVGTTSKVGTAPGQKMTNHPKTIAITPDCDYVFSAFPYDRTLRMWDSTTGKQMAILSGQESVSAATVTPDGKSVVIGYANGKLRMWDLGTGTETTVFAGHPESPLGALMESSSIDAVAITPDGRHAVSASGDCTLRVWNLDTGLEEAVLVGHTNWVNAVAITPDSRRAVSASGDCTLRVWNLDTGLEEAVLVGHEAWVNAVAITPDGRHAVSASEDCTLRVWEL